MGYQAPKVVFCSHSMNINDLHSIDLYNIPIYNVNLTGGNRDCLNPRMCMYGIYDRKQSALFVVLTITLRLCS